MKLAPAIEDFLKEATFLHGDQLPSLETLRGRLENNRLDRLKNEELKTLLRVLKAKHSDAMGYQHPGLKMNGTKAELLDRLTAFLEGPGMQDMIDAGAFSSGPSTHQQASGSSRSGSYGGTSSSSLSSSQQPSAPRTEEPEIICLSSDTEDDEPRSRPPARSSMSTSAYGANPQQPDQNQVDAIQAMRLAMQQALYQRGMPATATSAFAVGSTGVGGGGMAAFGGAHQHYGGGAGMRGEPKRSSTASTSSGSSDESYSPPGKKPRSGSPKSGKVQAGTVEVKQEKVDPFRAMCPSPRELMLVNQMNAESGIPACECLTALRANNGNVQQAIQWFCSALDISHEDIHDLERASILSEKENDAYKKAERMQMDQLQYKGDVVGSNLFKNSLILDEKVGSKAVRTFVQEHCCSNRIPRPEGLSAPAQLPSASPSQPPQAAAAPPPPPSPTSTAGVGPADKPASSPMAERRVHIVRLFMWEKHGIRCYHDPARAYIRRLIERLDRIMKSKQPPPSSVPRGEKERWEAILPLAMLKEEADTLQRCIVDYPEANTNGVPPLFLEAQGCAFSLDEDGVEFIAADKADHAMKGAAVAEGKDDGGGGGKRGRRTSVPECIELLDEDD